MKIRLCFYALIAIITSLILNGASSIMVLGSSGGSASFFTNCLVYLSFWPSMLLGIPEKEWWFFSYPSWFINVLGWIIIGLLLAIVKYWRKSKT